jgi:hypothetical protein
MAPRKKISNGSDDNKQKLIPISTEREEAYELLQRIFALDLKQCDLTVCLASAQEGTDVPLFRRAQLSENAAGEFREAIDVALEQHKKWQAEGNLVLTEFSADGMLENGVIEHLRLSDYPVLAPQIEGLQNFRSLERFDASEKTVENLRFYTMVLNPPAAAGFKDPIYYYRRATHTLLLSESARYALVFHRKTGIYETIEEPVLLFDYHVDCISCGDHMYILQKFYFYTIFGFMDALRDAAERALATLEAMDLIHGFDMFKQDCMRNKNKIMILSKAYHKPYFQYLTMPDLEQVIDSYGLQIDVEIVNRKHKLKYNPRNPWAILHLLDDFIAESPLTQISYQVKGKSEIKKRHP